MPITIRSSFPFSLTRSPSWLVAFMAAVAVCALLFAVNAWSWEIHPGTAWGIGYGVACTVLLLAAGAYSLRRRAPRRGPAPSKIWLRVHVYGGALFLLLVLMHSGFRLPNGFLGWALWSLSLIIVAGGLAGVLIQRWIPRLLTSGLSTEVHYQRIPELVDAVRERAEELAARADPSIREHYRRCLAGKMERPRPRAIFFVDITGGTRSDRAQMDHLGRFLAPEEKKKLDELRDLYETKVELDAHYTLQRALRWWLYGHVPFSLLLIVLVAFHIFSILYY